MGMNKEQNPVSLFSAARLLSLFLCEIFSYTCDYLA